MREYGFSRTVFSRKKKESTILSLYEKIRVSEYLTFRIFYTMNLPFYFDACQSSAGYASE